MSRRWAPPKPKPPQIPLRLEERGLFTPSVKLQPATAVDAAAALGINRGGDSIASVGGLAGAMVGVLQRHTARTRLSGVMRAIAVRGEVYQYLTEHAGGATADEIAYALKYSVLTVRPRVSELRRMNRIVDFGARRPNQSGRPAIVWRVSN